jgi:hypothetical protein
MHRIVPSLMDLHQDFVNELDATREIHDFHNQCGSKTMSKANMSYLDK